LLLTLYELWNTILGSILKGLFEHSHRRSGQPVENGQPERAGDIYRRGAERGLGGGRRRTGRRRVRLHEVGAERTTAGRVHRGEEAGAAPPHTTAAARHVEEIVELCDGALHVAVAAAAAPEVVVLLLAAATAEHRKLFDWTAAVVAAAAGFSVRRGRRRAHLVQRVDEVAAGSVGTEADAVVCAAHVRLVLRMAVDGAQLGEPVRELALLTVLAHAVLLEGPAHFCLVSGRRLLGLGRESTFRKGTNRGGSAAPHRAILKQEGISRRGGGGEGGEGGLEA